MKHFADTRKGSSPFGPRFGALSKGNSRQNDERAKNQKHGRRLIGQIALCEIESRADRPPPQACHNWLPLILLSLVSQHNPVMAAGPQGAKCETTSILFAGFLCRVPGIDGRRADTLEILRVSGNDNQIVSKRGRADQ
jgi:hypothetical protein